MPEHRLLEWFVRLVGAVMLLAAVAVVMPTAWMIQAHQALGLGAWPGGPLIDYLSRSTSALYAMHGLLLLALASDVRRYLPLLRLLALLHGGFGLAMLGIDLHAGMPWYWTAVEGPGIVAGAGVLLALTQRLERSGSVHHVRIGYTFSPPDPPAPRA